MGKFALGVAFALAIVSGSIKANATVWRNYASGGFANPYYLTTYYYEGQPLYIQTYNYSTYAQLLWVTPDRRRTDFTTITMDNWAPPDYTEALVVGLTGNKMANGTSMVAWRPTGDLSQDWWAEPTFTDVNGAQCYVLVNANSPPGRVFVLGVSGGKMVDHQPIILWDYFADPLGHGDQYWCSYKWGADNSVLVPDTAPVYPNTCSMLHKGQSLIAGTPHDSVTSCDGRFFLVMQGDGNLVLYQNGVGALWATGTNGRADNPTRAMLQFDGRLAVKSKTSQAWSSGASGDHLLVQDDGNVVLYAGAGTFDSPVWASNTCCR